MIFEERSGFLDYARDRIVTQDFITDVRRLAVSLYFRYHVNVFVKKALTVDDFQDLCVEKVLQKLPEYNPEKGHIKNYIYTIIRNETSNAKSKYKRELGVDFNSEFYAPGSPAPSGFDLEADEDFQLRDDIRRFAKKCASVRVVLDQNLLYDNILAGFFGPVETVFLWTRSEAAVSKIMDETLKTLSVVDFARQTGLDEFTALALYLLIGDKFFCCARLLRGCSLKFPKTVTFGQEGEGRRMVYFDSHERYPLLQSVDEVGGKFSQAYPSDFEAGDVVVFDGGQWELVENPRLLLGYYLAMAKEYQPKVLTHV